MPGKMCPRCGRPTFFETTYGGKCTKCDFTMTVPPNGGKPGRGEKCLNCGRWTVFNGKCTQCNARYSKGGLK